MVSMIRRLLSRLACAVWPGRAGVEAAREIASHLQLLEEDLVRRGMSRDDARAEARRRFGGSAALTADRHRDARSFVWVDDLRWDVRHAARLLRRDPLFALTAILSLAIGIGANTTVFTVAHALLFRDPVGVAHPDRLVDIGSSRNGRGFSTISYPTYLDIRDRASTLDGVYAYSLFPQAMSLADPAGAPSEGAERLFGSLVSANYFAVLGAAPSFGQLFRPDAGPDDAVVVLSHRFWSRRFSGDRAVVGRILRVNDRPFVVAGVAAEGFQGTGVFAEDVWIPLTAATDGASLSNRGAVWLNAGGRLKPGAAVTEASAELDAIGRALAREHPDSQNASVTLRAIALSPMPGSGGPIAAFLALLVGIVSMVLLIACANLAGVLLARAAARRREIAVRLAIGAGRRRLVRQLLVETLLLFSAGGAAALAIARAATSLLVSMMPAVSVPVGVSFALDGRTIAFTAGLAFAAALASGLAPALQASRADVVSALKDETPLSSRLRLRHVFVVGQVACSVLLVVVAGLFVRALQKVGSAHPGFEPHGVELASLNLALGGYTDTTGPLFARNLIARVRALPDVEDATFAAALPGGFERFGLGAIGPADAPAGDAHLMSADWNIIEPRYFATIRMALVAGRDFSAADARATEPVAIVGEGVVRRFWPGVQPSDAVGKYLLQRSFDPRIAALTTLTVHIIGVARDPTYGTLLEGTTGLYVYVPMQQQYRRGMPTMIVARSRDGRRLAEELRSLVSTVNPNLPIVASRSADDYTSLGVLPQRIVASVAGGLGLVGLLLAGIGVYGVTAYAVARRMREFGVRIALGATGGDIVVMVLRQGLGLTAAGAAGGLVLAVGAGSAATAYLFGVTPMDPLTFGVAALLFALVGLAACYAPARRATRVDPVVALRCE
ncbi:MAG TPA: ADOP family duplicated permease [Vicinamibacterales bacterium]|nr:ADOP family duplicated permease [Vicinamibacterales bacterium]